MSNSPQPPLPQTLDFSNVGRTLTFGSIEPAPLFHEVGSIDYVEHNNSRLRLEDTFAIGRPSPPPPNVQRVTIPHLHFPRIRTESKFKPIDHEKYYKTHCTPGHVRVFRSLIGSTLLEEKAFLHRDMALNDFRTYVMSIVDPFVNVVKTPEGKGFSFIMPKEDRRHLIDTWNKNLELRFKFRCLLSAWMVKKAKKNEITIQNYTTLEDPNPTNSIIWLDMNNRCTYRIDGDTLLKSMSMYLLNSSFGSPEPLWPKNPNTNMPLTHGQLVHIFFELYSWCGKNKKKIPSILTRFHDHNFCLHELMLHNKPLLAYHASVELFRDLGSEDAVEQMLDCVENYGNSMISRLHYEAVIPKWVEKVSVNHHLIKRWQAMLPDILQYEQFKIFTHDGWSSLLGLRMSVKALWDETVISISETVKSKSTVKRRIPIGVIEDVPPVQNTPPNVPPVNNSSNWVRLAIIEHVENAPPNIRLDNNSGYRIEPVQAPTLYVDESHLHSSSNAAEAIIEHIHNINPLPIDLLDSISSFTNDEIHIQYQIQDMLSMVYSLPIPPSSSSSVVTEAGAEEKQQESDEANV
jgi:hypothetical protein